MQNSDGMRYAPMGANHPVVEPGEFHIAAVALDHGHIHGMVNGLTEAGATLKWIYDPDPAKVRRLLAEHPGARAARSEDEVLEDPAVKLVAAAAVPSERCPLGLRAMRAGKDYFTDKTPLVSLAQLDAAKAAAEATGRKYMVYYSERLHVQSAVYAGELIRQGAIGRVVQVIGLGPHRLNAASRPEWFFQREKYGGILCDIGSHQIEQYLFYSGARDATVTRAQVANYSHPEYPELEDFGDCMLLGDNGTTNYFRVDWFTPDGLSSWGDGRTVILGTKGYVELRKYVDPGTDGGADTVIWVDGEREHKLSARGATGFPFFGALVLDCLNRTERAMTQAHAFKAAELCVRAQLAAQRIGPD